MASPTVKTTYSLDLETVKALEALAKRWGVPKSEALRRVIRSASQRSSSEEPDAIRALNELQRSLALSLEDARRWEKETRAERRASSRRLEGKPR
ncbi:MAG: ribbon-helix-helix protein, CopG family [Vicinamibacteria bacterium]